MPAGNLLRLAKRCLRVLCVVVHFRVPSVSMAKQVGVPPLTQSPPPVHFWITIHISLSNLCFALHNFQAPLHLHWIQCDTGADQSIYCSPFYYHFMSQGANIIVRSQFTGMRTATHFFFNCAMCKVVYCSVRQNGWNSFHRVVIKVSDLTSIYYVMYFKCCLHLNLTGKSLAHSLAIKTGFLF